MMAERERNEEFPSDEEIREKEGTGEMTVREAGHLGGEKGGQKVKRLIEEGEEAEERKVGREAA
jgi:hypothetical protein